MTSSYRPPLTMRSARPTGLLPSLIIPWVLAGCSSGSASAPAEGSSSGPSGTTGAAESLATTSVPTTAGASGDVPDSTSETGSPGVLLGPIDDLALAEETTVTVEIPARAGARVFVVGAPPGSVFDEPSRALRLSPDFTQGGSYEVEVFARDGGEMAEARFQITVEDTIRPPDPVVESTEEIWHATLVHVVQTTDDFLDPPGLAGRTFAANIVVPDGAGDNELFPLYVGLHGSGGAAGTGGGDGTRFGLGPSEPYVSWWTGQHDGSPGEPGPDSVVPNTSQRRILHLIDWIQRTYPGVDSERIHVTGTSMGGSGAFFLATRYAYHFASVSGFLNLTSMVGAKQGQRDAMAEHWGAQRLNLPDDQGISVWERYDITRALRDDVHARNQFYTSLHGVTDSIISFDHVSTPSPNTGLSWVEAARTHHVGHRVAWDQRDHSTNEASPLPGNWTGELPPEAELRRDRAFPAFTNSALDQTPPTWDAGTQTFAGGDGRGMINRYLAWDTASVIDERDRFEMALFVRTEPAAESIGDDYPLVGHGYPGPLPVMVDVTPRRIQGFAGLPGETIAWSFAGLRGTVTADDTGAWTIPGLPLGANAEALVLTRTP